MSEAPSSVKLRFLTPNQLAERWQVSGAVLRLDRSNRVGCTYFKMGRLVRYKVSDVLAYESACRIETSEKCVDGVPGEDDGNS